MAALTGDSSALPKWPALPLARAFQSYYGRVLLTREYLAGIIYLHTITLSRREATALDLDQLLSLDGAKAPGRVIVLGVECAPPPKFLQAGGRTARYPPHSRARTLGAGLTMFRRQRRRCRISLRVTGRKPQTSTPTSN